MGKEGPFSQSVLDAYRKWGYLKANLDFLGRLMPLDPPELVEPPEEVAELCTKYCASIGAEFMHIPDPDKRSWIQEKVEAEDPLLDHDRILRRLIRADLFEQFLQSRYLGNKRFSIQGVDGLVVLLEEVLETATQCGTRRVIMAMSHRGRLNVMHQIVGRRAQEILTGFEDVDPRSTLGGGDVKYHLGATGSFTGKNGIEVAVHLVSNPSHLEAVDPVALGRVRAWQTRLGVTSEVLPIEMHGDAAFAGQGILAETLNLSKVPGFEVYGTLHVIINNLIGFTAVPEELHSSRFASDAAKRLLIPIFHVNGEDYPALIKVSRLAAEYRCRFREDVVIDLIGYRRYGHSEVDDPTITQPRLYRQISERQPAWKLFADDNGLDAGRIEEEIRNELQQAYDEATGSKKRPVLRVLPDYWNGYVGGPCCSDYEVGTGVDVKQLAELGERLTRYPADFHIHEKVQKLLEQRREMARGRRPVDFAMAEAFAFASLLQAGHPVRFSGQDSRRGTFNQRHAVLTDTEDESDYIPLQHIDRKQGRFEIYDSVLSEAAVLGFEYGFSRDYPEALVLWEAQFGDFANGAQIIIDQFIVADEDKWDLLSGLVLLLPHGYEGQGPEHSSARLERFLQLAAEDNMQVCQPSTAAQYFHLLRRQVLRKWRKPLVVMTPKSFLRQSAAASELSVFGSGRFKAVLADPETSDAERIVVCSGKVGHELRREREKRKDGSLAIVFLEQIYPFPEEELKKVLAAYSGARDVIWLQEEPANMGALSFVLPRLRHVVGTRKLRSIKRSASSSPATGSAKAHAIEQETLLKLVFAGVGETR